MVRNRVKQLWSEGKATVGSWLSLCSPLATEAMARNGFDWLVVDAEHSPVDDQTMVSMFQAICTTDTVPMVRVAWNDPMLIKRVLDCGAYGVVIPMINSRQEAIEAVKACRFPPQGIRSMGGGRARLYYGADYPQFANREIAVIIQIEHIDAVNNVDDILSVEGVDAFFIGPNDLAASLGVPLGLDNTHPRHVEAVSKVLAAGKRHGVVAGIHTGSPEAVNQRIAQGFQFIALSSDMGFMMRAATLGINEIIKDRSIK